MTASGHAMRACACTLAAALVLAGCSSGPGFLAPDDTPQSVYGSFLAARYASANRDVDQSARLYADALAFEPNSGLISERAFLSALMAGDFPRADQAALAAGDEEGATALVHLYLAAAELAGARFDRPAAPSGAPDAFSDFTGAIIDQWAKVRARRVDEALAAADQVSSPFARAGQLLIQRAMLLERAGDHDRAESAYRAADATLNLPDHTAVLLGEFLERRGRRTEAAALYRGRLDVGRSPGDPAVAAALQRIEDGRRAPRFPRPDEAAARALFAPAALLTRQAPADYSALFLRTVERLDPDFQRNTFALAQILEELELDEAALAAYRSITEGPFATRAGVQAAWLAFQSGDRDAAIAEARALVEADGAETARLVLADMLRASERCSEAARIYEQVAARRAEAGVEPDWRHVYYAGVCRQVSEGWQSAEPLFLQALDLAPDEPQVLNHLGYNWIVRDRRVEEGFTLVARAAERAPENGAVLDSLGWGHFKQGRVEEAVRWLEDAAALSPDNPTINWHLGDAYAAAGRDLEARFQWRRALELDPGERERTLIEQRLEGGLQAGPADLQ